jgi:hypothetical protein
MEKVKLLTRMSSFQDVEKAFKELEKTLNELKQSVNTEAEGMVSDTKGKSGDIKLTQKGDKSYLFEIRTKDGWKTPVVGESAVSFREKPPFVHKDRKKTITEIETEDTSTGDTKAKKTIYDEKNDEFAVNHLITSDFNPKTLKGIPRPDFDSGWLQDASSNAAITIEHSLDTIEFSLIDLQISNSSTGANATWVHATDDDPGAYIVQVKDNNNIYVGTGDDGPASFDCAGLTWDQAATHFRLRLWK